VEEGHQRRLVAVHVHRARDLFVIVGWSVGVD
jgi:hypothetical protein